MLSSAREIAKPKNEQDFEDLCAIVYGAVFEDPTPKKFGRRGQGQGGVDLLVTHKGERIAIQCKRYQTGSLKLHHVENELNKVDQSTLQLHRFIVTTTANADAALQLKVIELSAQRQQQGRFPVDIEFWDDIERHIKIRPALQALLDPTEPGGLYYKTHQSVEEMRAETLEVKALLQAETAIPKARQDALNQWISNQLDAVHEQVKSFQYGAALKALEQMGSNLTPFDFHQKARWYLQRGVCYLHQANQAQAIKDFFKAAEIYPHDDKFAAAKVRAYLLSDDVPSALQSAKQAIDDFPNSSAVWVIYLNAKLVNKEYLSLDDVPPILRAQGDVLHMMGWAQHAAGNLQEAITYLQRANESADCSFFTKRSALALALEAVTKDQIKSAYHFISANEKETLQGALRSMSPWNDNLWNVQSTSLLLETIEHMAIGFNVTGKPEEALKFLNAAQSHGLQSPMLDRVALMSYRDLERIVDIIRFGQERMGQLDQSGLIVVAETAANEGIIGVVEAAANALQQLPEGIPRIVDLMEALKWQARWKSQLDRERLKADALAFSPEACNSIYIACAVAGVLQYSKAGNQSNLVLERALDLVDDETNAQEILVLADLLCYVGKYPQAAKLYERFVVGGFVSHLHQNLLLCYVKGHQRGKARDLIQSFPPQWTSNDMLRQLAIEWGQQVEDYPFLDSLVDVELAHSPKNSGVWLLAIGVAYKRQNLPRLQQLLKELPEDVTGSSKQLANLADIELKFGNEASGLRRLYRMYRQRMGNLEAATAFFVTIIAHGELNIIDGIPTMISDGVTVELVDEQNNQSTFSIDFNDVSNLLEYPNFLPPKDPRAVSYMGRGVGETLEVTGAFGLSKVLRITRIYSIYIHLIQLAQQTIDSSMMGSPGIGFIPVPPAPDGFDFSHIEAMMKKRANHTAWCLDRYQQLPVTIAMLAKLLGQNVTEIVCGWQIDGVPMVVSTGNPDQRTLGFEAANKPDMTFIIDAATIAELVSHKVEGALKAFPNLLCSGKTLAALQNVYQTELDGNKDKRSYMASGPNGEIQTYTFDAKQIEERIIFFKKMVETVTTYCKVVPVIGPNPVPENLQQLESIITPDDMAVLLLVGEHNATLLTIDQRLGAMATEIYKRPFICYQDALLSAKKHDAIGLPEYQHAIARQFLTNRHFVSVTAQDLIFMVRQGGSSARWAIKTFKRYLSSESIDLDAATNITFHFLTRLLSFCVQPNGFSEVFGHLVEAIMRSSKCNLNAFVMISLQFIFDISHRMAGGANKDSLQYEAQKERFDTIKQLLIDELGVVHRLIQNPASQDRPVNIEIVMGYNPPLLKYQES